MTSDFSKSPDLPQEQFDIGPLSWVMGEVREAITNAGKMLTEALDQDAETRPTTLLHAKSYLHQAHGALQIVDIDGVSIVTETIEELLERLQNGQLEMSKASVEVIVDAFHAVLRYLEDLLSGAPHQPVRLFPYYRALLELKGAERIHPADLFFPSLSAKEQIPELAVSSKAAAVSYTGLRQRFEKLLLTVLTSKDKTQQKLATQSMHDLIAEIENGQSNSQAKAFWVVMRAFVEAVGFGAIDHQQQYVKQIFGRINLQIRRLVEGVSTIPERLLRDALFFLAQVENPSPFVSRVRKAYQLDDKVPQDYNQKNYGQITAGALTTAKEQLSAVKNLWGRIANGETGLADKFSQKMSDLAETGAGLNAPALAKLLRELNGIARSVAHSPDGSKLGIELATSLLFVEHALDHVTRLPGQFAERAEEITKRLLSVVSGETPQTQASWMGEISREAQQRQTLGVLVAEMQSSLRHIEKILDEYFRTPNAETLKPIDGNLHQIGGALAMLDQDDAMLAVEHTRQMIGKFGDDPALDASAQAAAHENVAQNVGALSFFIETLQSQPDTVKKKFSFDREAGLFRSNLLEAHASKELLPSADILLPGDEAHGQESKPAVLQTAEEELAQQQQESARLAASLAEAPGDASLQAQLKSSLESERSVAILLDDVAASDRAKSAIDLLGKTDLADSSATLQDIVAAPVAETAPAAAVAQDIPDGDDAIDAELLEIFLMEADEVLGFVQTTLPLSRKAPDNQEYLTSLRRSFHTLKGSGRMVGLTVFGEAAWSIEQVMNLWLSDSRDGNENLYALLERTASEMVEWVNELKQNGVSPRTGKGIIVSAERVKAGQDYVDEPEVQTAPEPVQTAAPETVVEEIPVLPVLTEPEIAVALPVAEEPVIAAADAVAIPDAIEALTFEAEPVTEEIVMEATPLADDLEVRAEIAQATPSMPADLVTLDEPVIEAGLPESPDAPELSIIEDFAVPDQALVDTVDASTDAAIELSDLTLDAATLDELGLVDASAVAVPAESETLLTELNELADAPELLTEQVAETVLPVIEEPLTLEAVELRDAQDLTSDELGAEPIPEEKPAELVSEETPAVPEVATAKIIDFPDLSAPAPSVDDNIKRIGDIEISLPLYSIYMAETDEIVRFLAQDFAEWRHEPDRHVSTHAIHASHSLAGSSATVGLKPLQELAHSLEFVLQRLERHPVVLVESEYDVLERALDSAKRMLQKFALSEMAAPAPEEIRQLEHLLQVVIERSNAGADEEFITSTNEKLDPVVLSDAAMMTDLPTAHDELPVLETLSADQALELLAQPAELAVTALPEEPEIVAALPADELTSEFDVAEPIQAEALPEAAPPAETMVDRMAAIMTDAMDDIAPPELLAPLPVVSTEVEPSVALAADAPVLETVAELPAPEPEPEQVIEPVSKQEAEPEVVTPAQTPAEPVAQVAVAEYVAPAADGNVQIRDELDMDLLPVFIEEGNDLLPMVGQLLRSWQEKPDDMAIPQSIARIMHTIKGSARMAGAMGLGQHIHDMESRIETLMHGGSAVRASLLDDLLARHDYSMQMFDRLLHPEAHVAPLQAEAPLTTAQELDQFQEQQAAKTTEAPVVISELVNLTPVVPVMTRTNAPAVAAPVNAPAAPGAPVTLVRVRADILDRLVNQAGEVSISRSRLENEVSTLRSSLSELTENVNRLRDQLREVEIQAETQITSRMALSGDREFDPLEFDRFTRLQELTRMMAESVSDVATVQTNLTRTIDGASNDLQVQARLTRDLQQDLMRVRMIPFASISERLYRVTRQTSKEIDKRVNLDIRGATVEMDRGVLEKMAGPFEHLLRNAIVHGIESREQRRNSGKEETGELLIEIRQEGNEVVIRFSDDGQGLNLKRIREKAVSVGLITNEDNPGELETANMIFEPGFSTATEITELAGRGVGMDVVRSEAASLGGRVEVVTHEGKGAEFTIRLPLTLAVTQVVLLSSGGRTFAVPSVLVEQVQQLKSNALANAYNDGAVMWQGQRVAMYYLSSMLGQDDATPMTQQYTPLLIMKSGTERVAIHVDDVLGNREVVVKNIGPQLARMTGIAGATVLGSGEIVLILNPVPLAQRMEHEHARLQHLGAEAVPDMGAVANLHTATEVAETKSEPVQGLRTQHTVMVVDDSLTVRRVTQRLLTREGYQVILAKDGIDALEQLQSVTPDVMLVDIEMPRMDGFDLTRNVRSDSRTSHIPIIMITSRTADKHRNYAKELGVNEYFGKPYREDDLLGAIMGFVGKDAAVIV
ncbi:Hpt domain-containing protein [Undibacterium sp. TS12]|uniref:hybrid sensor histidine kinase/response regulator n=1 Tax=Undibacterium sp. TS12 TaxID=2908202 RepID=UPI001F4C76E6|nr:Hpt domain-containing protein [Undibacterium sp. TS12]MCH8620141.1 Hpt domain-containing protein [Undibacterium sp. TS12]